ncbi:unnamed protein product [Amoebophrya sp. A120]|nr:unnamed protein product [Amoebophrya sp. A120]|eukprot:GSA120T00016024001.1
MRLPSPALPGLAPHPGGKMALRASGYFAALNLLLNSAGVISVAEARGEGITTKGRAEKLLEKQAISVTPLGAANSEQEDAGTDEPSSQHIESGHYASFLDTELDVQTGTSNKGSIYTYETSGNNETLPTNTTTEEAVAEGGVEENEKPAEVEKDDEAGATTTSTAPAEETGSTSKSDASFLEDKKVLNEVATNKGAIYKYGEQQAEENNETLQETNATTAAPSADTDEHHDEPQRWLSAAEQGIPPVPPRSLPQPLMSPEEEEVAIDLRMAHVWKDEEDEEMDRELMENYGITRYQAQAGHQTVKDNGTLDLFKSMNETGMLTAFEHQDANRDLVIDEAENAELVHAADMDDDGRVTATEFGEYCGEAMEDVQDGQDPSTTSGIMGSTVLQIQHSKTLQMMRLFNWCTPTERPATGVDWTPGTITTAASEGPIDRPEFRQQVGYPAQPQEHPHDNGRATARFQPRGRPATVLRGGIDPTTGQAAPGARYIGGPQTLPSGQSQLTAHQAQWYPRSQYSFAEKSHAKKKTTPDASGVTKTTTTRIISDDGDTAVEQDTRATTTFNTGNDNANTLHRSVETNAGSAGTTEPGEDVTQNS